MSSYNQQQSNANINRFRSTFMSSTNQSQLQQQGIYNHRALSGSETDVSTSNENLSNEDRYVIRHTARQEPQGQENLQLQVYNSGSNRNSQRESSSSYNTLIIHSLGEDTWTGRNSGAKDSPDSLYNAALGHPNTGSINVGVYDSTSGATKRLSQGSNCSMPGSTGGNNAMLNSCRLSSGGNGNQVQDINDIPDDYLNQSSVLKHLAKEASNKAPNYIGNTDQHSNNDVIGATVDYGGSPSQSPQKQHYQHLLYSNNNSCNPSPTSTLSKLPTLTSQQQQQMLINRPSSATNNTNPKQQHQQQQQRQSNNKNNNLSKSQPDLSRADTAVESPSIGLYMNCNSAASVAGTQDVQQQAATIEITPQLQQNQHYSAPVLLRNSSGNGNNQCSVVYGSGTGPGPGPGLRYRRDVSMPRPRTRGRDMTGFDMMSGGGEPFVRDKTSAGNETWSADMIDMLLKENSALKLEVENCYARIGKSQKLEQEVLKVHSAHEDLVASCERRERLERTARTKLQLECRRLQDTNRLLRDQLDMQQVQLMATATANAVAAANNQVAAQVADGMVGTQDDGALQEYMRREMTKRDLLIAQFITQNKELGATKERQEIELTAQRATLQEQRTHIDILEAALTNAQGNVVRLEEECRKKQAYVERVGQLQRALSAMQIANDRREQTERSLRLQLELELERTNNNSQNNSNISNNANHNNNSSLGGEHNEQQQQQHGGEELMLVGDLKRQLREREEKLMRMEGDCSKWEQRYLEESALRQAAIDAASIPKDAKIAALEKTSQETEKIIAEARTDKIRHMDEAHAAQKKVADLESRLKDLESKLAERDAMIRVLNHKHTSHHYSSPHHTPHPSNTSDHHSHLVLSSREELVSSVLTSSTGFGSGTSYHSGSSDSSFAATLAGYAATAGESGSGFDVTKKALDNQIKEIDSQLDTQLLTKRALCCFPGFANPIATARKGKLPKPLLASLTQQQSTQPTTKKQTTHNNPSNTNNQSNNNTTDGATTPTDSQSSSVYDTLSNLHKLLPQASACNHQNNTSEILLLEKQGRSSQQQRMSDSSNVNLPPSSLPRPPPRSNYQPTSIGSTKIQQQTSNLRYNRLNNSDVDSNYTNLIRRKKSVEDATTNRQISQSPQRSMIPSPSTLNRYTRLVSSDTSANGSTVSLRKTSLSTNSSPRVTRFDRDSTLSDNSASSLPAPGKVRFYSGPSGGGGSIGTIGRRGSSLGRDGKNCNVVGEPQYRIQF